MKVTDAIIGAPGAFMPSSRPASAAGMTPVSRVQHMNSISLKLHRARRSGSAQRKTVAGRATSMKHGDDNDAAEPVLTHEVKST